jgi:hypothetical protein
LARRRRQPRCIIIAGPNGAGKGHDVPKSDVVRRFVRSWDNFERVYRPLADSWAVYEILTANLNYWREGLESKEETPCAEFRRRSRAGAAQSREGCGKDGADAWNTLVLLGKRKGRREETLAHRPS